MEQLVLKAYKVQQDQQVLPQPLAQPVLKDQLAHKDQQVLQEQHPRLEQQDHRDQPVRKVRQE
jgi:hypothetical protein